MRLVCGYWFTSLAGTALAVAAALEYCFLATGQVVWSVLWAAPVGLLLALIWRLRRALSCRPAAAVLRHLPGHGPAGHRRHAALTDWLADALDDIAGVRNIAGRDPDRPLTFGDLQGGNPDDPAISLQVMTTNLTEGRPVPGALRRTQVLLSAGRVSPLVPRTDRRLDGEEVTGVRPGCKLSIPAADGGPARDRRGANESQLSDPAGRRAAARPRFPAADRRGTTTAAAAVVLRRRDQQQLPDSLL